MSAEFKKGDPVVYPSHGVGEVAGLTTLELAGEKIRFYVIRFKDNMTLKIPVKRAAKARLRSIGDTKSVDRAIKTIKGPARSARGMWSRRAQEYQNKINSGDLAMAAQVVRDLHKNVDDPERSYSERVIYESALERLSCEFAAVQNIPSEQAVSQIETILKSKSARAANTDIPPATEANDNEEFPDLLGSDEDILAHAG